jgi:hypothetical protein
LGIVFIFRGEARDFGVKLTADDRTQRDGSSSVFLRSMSDILIGYSTLPGFTSNRDVYLGTWYIQAVCEVFMEHAWNTDVEDMLKMVSLSAFIIIRITWFLDFVSFLFLKEELGLLPGSNRKSCFQSLHRVCHLTAYM